MITFLSIVVTVLVIALAIIAQYRKIMMDKLIDEVRYQQQWIDDIIKALEADDESVGDTAIDYLLIAEEARKGPLD